MRQQYQGLASSSVVHTAAKVSDNLLSLMCYLYRNLSATCRGYGGVLPSLCYCLAFRPMCDLDRLAVLQK